MQVAGRWPDSRGLVAALAMAMAAGACHAQVVWSGAVGSDWDTGANWIGGVKPTPAQTAVFNNASVTNQPWVNSSNTIHGLQVDVPTTISFAASDISLWLAGTGSASSGSAPLTLAGGGALRVGPATTFGPGGVVVAADTLLELADADASVGPPTAIEIRPQGLLSVGGGSDVSDRIDAASAGGIYAFSGANSNDIDMATLGDGTLFLGSTAGGAGAGFSGMIAPGVGRFYRLGGGGETLEENLGTQLRITRQGALAGANSLQVGGTGGSRGFGRVRIDTNQTFLGNGSGYEVQVYADGGLITGSDGGTPFGDPGNRIFVEGQLVAAFEHGSFVGAPYAFMLRPGSELVLSDDGYSKSQSLFSDPKGHGQGRWGDTTPITLDASEFRIQQAGSASGAETVGLVAFRDSSRLTISRFSLGGNPQFDLTVEGLQRGPGNRGVLLVANPGRLGETGGEERVLISGSTLGTTNGLLSINGEPAPYVRGEDYGGGDDIFLSLDPTNGLVNVHHTSTNLTTSGPTDLVLFTASVTLTSDAQTYTLEGTNSSGVNITLNPSVRLSVHSGGILMRGASGNNSIKSADPGNPGILDFGMAEGVVCAVGNVNRNIEAIIQGSNGLTKWGLATVDLTAPNAFTGPVTIAEGTLRLQNAGALPPSNALHVAYGATLDCDTQGAVHVTDLSGRGSVLLDGADLTIEGTLNPGAGTAPGSLTLAGSGLVLLSAASLAFSLGTPDVAESDMLVVPQADVDVTGLTATLSTTSRLPFGTYTLIDTNGGTMTGSPGGCDYPGGTLKVVDNDLVLTVRAVGSVMIVR